MTDTVDTYLILKWVHIVSSTILFGTGIGSAFYFFVANRSRNLHHIHFATKYVVIADWLFTTPSVIIQFFSGMALMHIAGYTFQDSWIRWGLLLYFFAGACWVPVVWMQIKMRDMATAALADGRELQNATGS